MKSILLIRHGETEWNQKFMTQGCHNTKLTNNGIQQGHKLCERIKHMKRDYIKIFTSDFERCNLVSEVIGKELNVAIEITRDLREMNFGEWEGLTTEEIKMHFSEDFNRWRLKPQNAIIPGGEKLIDVQKRCLRATIKILNSFDKGTAIIVSHSISIKLIILGILKLELNNFYKLSINNVSISEIQFREYGPVLTLLNDVSHLNL